MMTSVENFYSLFQPNLSTLWTCLPEAILCALALLALVFDVVCKGCGARRATNGFLRAALIALFICVVGGAFPVPAAEVGPAGAMATIFALGGGFSRVATSLFILCAFLALSLSGVARSREGNEGISVPATTHLVLVATAAASLLLKATNFVAFFVLLETLTVCLYALVGSNRRSAYSLEAGVKYLIVGGISGALMLFGIVLLYGGVAMSGVAMAQMLPEPLSYFSVAQFLNGNPDDAIGLVGAAMVLAGVMFKLGVFPMQFWIPDVYQGAPTHTTFFLATLSKATGFFLMCVMLVVFNALAEKLVPALLVCTLISIVYANVTALGQRNVKRLLGLSGVSHAGYLMLGLLALYSFVFVGRSEPPAEMNVVLLAVLLFAYLVVYIATIYPIFSVMAHMPARDDALQNFDDYEGLVKRSPLLAGTLGFGLGSLAGIPPTVGFIAKLGILYLLFVAGFYGSIAIMLACVVASVYYYFGWFRVAFSRGDSSCDGNEEKAASATAFPPLCPCSRVVLIAFSALMVLGSLVYWFVVQNCASLG